MRDLFGQFVLFEGWYPHLCLWLAVALKSSAVVLFGWGFATLLHARSSSARCWIWRATILAVVMIPVWEFGPNMVKRVRPVFHVEIRQTAAMQLWNAASQLKLVRSSKELNALQTERRKHVIVSELPPWEVTPPGSLSALDYPRAPWNTVEDRILDIWWIIAAGLAVIMIARIVLGAVWLRRNSIAAGENIIRCASAVAQELDIKVHPVVRVVDPLRSPLILGLWKPRIYLSSNSKDWTEDKLRSVCLHELSHFCRRDNFWQYFARVSSALFWWNPLVAYAGRRMAAAAEEAADDTVLLHRQAAEKYAATLVEIAAEQPQGRAPAAGLSMVGRHPLEKRIKALLRANPWRGRIGFLPVTMTLILLCSSIWGASVYLGAKVDIPNSPQGKTSTLTSEQRATLQRILKTNIERFNALRFLHFILEITPSEKGPNYEITAPQPTHMEAWVDEWTGLHRAEFRPFVSRWISGAAPFFISDTNEVNSGKNLYRFDVDEKPDDIRGDEPQSLDLYLGTREASEMIHAAQIALKSMTMDGDSPRYSLEEIPYNGKSMLRLREQFLIDGKISQQRTFIIDPSQDDMVVFGELAFPNAKNSMPSQWVLKEVGLTSGGVRYPARYQTIYSRNGIQTLADARVLSMEVLRELPSGFADLPKSIDDEFVAKDRAAIRYKNLTVSYRDAATGKAVSGVAVISRVNGGTAAKFTSDEKGEVLISLPEGEIKSLNVSAKRGGFVPQVLGWQKWGNPLQLPEKYEVSLQPAFPISGRVLTDQGKPISGAEVSLWISGPGPRTWSVFHDRLGIFGVTVKTDASGKWVFANAPRDLMGMGIRVSARGYRATTDSGLGDFRTTTGLNYASLRDGTADIKLSTGTVLVGKVQDEAGKPVKDCLITIGEDSWGSNLPTTKTDSAGNFILKGLASKTDWISAESPDHQPFGQQITLPLKQPMTITLAAGKVLRGRILKEDGTPSAGLNVRSDKWRKLRTLTFATQTDKEGRFTWKGAPDDAVTFSFGGCQSREFLSGLPLTATTEEQTIIMKPALRLKARVVDKATGKPLASFQVMPGYHFSAEYISWEKDKTQFCQNGQFEWATDYMSADEVFEIKAEGYEALQTQPFATKQENFEVTFQLAAKK